MSTPIRTSAVLMAAFRFCLAEPTFASTPVEMSTAAVSRRAAMGTPDPFIFRGGSFRFDRFLTQSKSGRCAAFVKNGRIVILDSVSQRRIDLTAVGATAAKLLEFTYGHWVMFIRVVEGVSEVVAVNLETSESRVLFALRAPLYRVWVSVEGNELFVAEAEHDEVGEAASPDTDGSEPEIPCLENIPYAYERRVAIDVPASRLHRVLLLPLDDQVVREERLEPGYGCLADGRQVVVESSFGGLLAGAANLPEPGAALHGPVRWVRTESEPSDQNCIGVKRPRRNTRAVHESPSTRGRLGMDVSTGYRYGRFAQLNRSISERGYEQIGGDQFTLGMNFLVLFRRYWVGVDISWVNVQNAQVAPPEQATLALDGGAAGLSLGYEAHRSDRVTLTPSLGVRWLSTRIDYPAERPPFYVPPSALVYLGIGIEEMDR